MKLFTQEQVDAVGQFVRYLEEQLDLQQWKIVLQHEPANIDSPQAGAAIKPIYGRNTASLFLAHDFFTYSIEDMEHYLIHEMCHLLSTHVDDVIENGPETIMGKAAFTIFHQSYLMASERMTDHLAVVIKRLIADGPNRKKAITALNKVRIQ